MELAGGDREKAALALGIKMRAMNDRLSAPALKAKWDAWEPTAPPTQAVQISRPSIVIHEEIPAYAVIPKAHRPQQPAKINAPTEEVVARIAEEDEMIRQGLENLPFSEAEKQLAIGFQRFQKRAFGSSFELLGGGIISQFIKIVGMVNQTTQEIDSCGSEGNVPPLRESMLREDRARLLAIQVQMYDRGRAAALAQDSIDARKSAKEDGNAGKTAKPGFGALVQTTGDVHLHQTSVTPAPPPTPPPAEPAPDDDQADPGI